MVRISSHTSDPANHDQGPGPADPIQLQSASAGRAETNTQEAGPPRSKKRVSKWDVPLFFCLYLPYLVCGFNVGVTLAIAVPLSTQLDSLRYFTWFVQADLVAQAVIKPISGRFIATYGQRLVQGIAVVTFALGSLLCGFSRTGPTFIVGQAIIGVGAGAQSQVLSDVISNYDAKAVLFGGMGVAFSLGSVLGGALGGRAQDDGEWRVTFWSQAPVIGLSAILPMLHSTFLTRSATPAEIDWGGAGLLTCTLLPFLWALTAGGNIFPWKSPLVWAFLLVALLCFVLFFLWEHRMGTKALIPTEVIFARGIGLFHLVTLTSLLLYGAFSLYITVYFQLKNVPAQTYGLYLILPTGIACIGSVLVGWLMTWMQRHDARRSRDLKHIIRRWTLLCGLLFGLAIISGGALTGLLDFHRPVWEFVGLLSIPAFISGCLDAVLPSFVYDLLESEGKSSAERTVGASVNSSIRSIARTLSLAVAGVAYQAVLERELAARLRGQPSMIAGLEKNIADIFTLPEGFKPPAFAAFLAALKAAFGSSTAWMGVALILLVVMRLDGRLRA